LDGDWLGAHTAEYAVGVCAFAWLLAVPQVAAMNEITRHEQDALVAALEATVRQLTEANAELQVERARLAAERDAAQIAGENYVAAVDALNAVYQTGEQVYGEADMKLIMARDNAFDALRAALGPA
jgi:hypothetical protein